MDSVLRALAMYAILLLLFRLIGKRSLAQITTFDFVILLVVGEATAQALLGEDFSLIRAALVIATLIIVERFSDFLSWRFPKFRRTTESVPVILVEDGQVLAQAMRKSHLSEDDVVTAGRTLHGLERLDQIKWAVLESSGGISVVPKENAAPQA